MSRSTCVPGGHGSDPGIVSVLGIAGCDGLAGADTDGIVCPEDGGSGLWTRIGGSIRPSGV